MVVLTLPCLLESDACASSSHSLQKCFGARLPDFCVSSLTPELLSLELILFLMSEGHATLQSFRFVPFLCTCWDVVQVAELLQEKAALKKQNSRLERLEGLERALQAERDARTRQLSNALKTESLD